MIVFVLLTLALDDRMRFFLFLENTFRQPLWELHRSQPLDRWRRGRSVGHKSPQQRRQQRQQQWLNFVTTTTTTTNCGCHQNAGIQIHFLSDGHSRGIRVSARILRMWKGRTSMVKVGSGTEKGVIFIFCPGCEINFLIETASKDFENFYKSKKNSIYFNFHWYK